MTNAAIILAGGNSRRMKRDKLELGFDGSTLAGSAVSRFSAVFDDVYLSVADETRFPEITVTKIKDIVKNAGPMAGLHAALSALPGTNVFLVAADMPYACPNAAMLISQLGAGYDACVIKLPGGNVEPLYGYYNQAVLPLCEKMLELNKNSMLEIINNANTRFISPDELGGLWNERLLVNINFPGDYERLGV